jgi:hypothetical protein
VGWNYSGLICGHILAFYCGGGGLWESAEIVIRIAGLCVQTRTRDLPNTKQDSYPFERDVRSYYILYSLLFIGMAVNQLTLYKSNRRVGLILSICERNINFRRHNTEENYMKIKHPVLKQSYRLTPTFSFAFCFKQFLSVTSRLISYLLDKIDGRGSIPGMGH